MGGLNLFLVGVGVGSMMAAFGAAYAVFPHVRSRVLRFLHPGQGDHYQIDTAMQAVIRAVPSPQRERFQAFHDDGALASPEAAARAVLAYLGRDDFGADEIADVRG